MIFTRNIGVLPMSKSSKLSILEMTMKLHGRIVNELDGLNGERYGSYDIILYALFAHKRYTLLLQTFI